MKPEEFIGWVRYGYGSRNDFGYIYLGYTDYYFYSKEGKLHWADLGTVGSPADRYDRLVIPVEFINFKQNLRPL